MKKNLAKKVTLSILAGAVLMSSGVVWAGTKNPYVDGWTMYSSYYVWKGASGGASNGEVNQPGDDFSYNFYGKYDNDTDPNTHATGGMVTIENGTFGVSSEKNLHGFIYGGITGNGNATENTVKITGGNFSYDIYGGQGDGTKVESNSVLIKKGNFYPGVRDGSNGDYNGIMIYGGGSYSSSTLVKNNTVQVDNITLIGADVVLENNTFTRKGLHGIYGGFNAGLSGNSKVEGNKVILTGGEYEFTGSPGTASIREAPLGIAGGYVRNGEVSGNIVSISGGKINGDIYGGYSGSGVAQGNTVTINGGTFSKNIIGGYSSSGNVDDNTVTISGGEFTGDYLNIIGGYSSSGNAGVHDKKGNKVIIKGGKFTDIEIIGGFASKGNAEKNVVEISEVDEGSTLGDIIGGFAKGTTGDATGNTVTISAGKFSGAVYGGCSVGGKASGNTVNISGTANLENVELYGGAIEGNPGVKYFFGGQDAPNTLNIYAWNNNKVKSIAGFDVINFANVDWDTTKPVVEVGALVLSDIVIKDGNEIRVDTEIKVGTVNVAGGTELENGAKMTLLSATEMYGEISNDNTKVVINYGIAEKFNGYVEQVDGDKKIYLKLGDGPEEGYTVPTGGSDTPPGNPKPEDKPTENPEDKPTEDPENKPTASRNDQVLVLGESRVAAVSFTNQGSELIETGLNALARDNEKDTKVFAAVYGNHSEYETGSHVNVNGWSGIVGIGKTNADGLTVGAFFENGEGNYSTHNIFTNDYIRGDGEACYNGGGFLVRKDNANGVYTEASLRAGNLQNELRNAVRNGSELTGYDIDTFYYGAHVGVGKVIPRGNDGDSIDVYGKFIYTHHDGETFDIGGTATKFDSVESERLRLGFRINEVQTNKLSMYYGAAWEYEFNGDAHDKIASFDLETPSLEGSTVIGEIGAHYKASDKWSIDLNGRAYVGQREGFSGSVQANYAF